MIEQGAVDDYFPEEISVPAVVVVSGVSKEVLGVFERPYTGTILGDAVAENQEPQIHVRTREVEGVKQGDTVTVDGATYNVVNVQPDGAGMTLLILSLD